MIDVIIAGIILIILLKIIFGITKAAVKILLFVIIIGIILYILNSFFPLMLLF